MAEWILVPCLARLRDEFNAIAPGRDKGADGSIGDQAHADRTSDHNPDETGAVPIHDSDHVNEVHALDIDSTGPWPAGVSFDAMVKFEVSRCALPNDHPDNEPRLRYVIWNHEWAESPDWRWKPYSGSSDPHTGHAHFSAEYVTELESDTSPWGLKEKFMATQFTDEDRKFFWGYAPPEGNPYTPGPDTTTMAGFGRYAPSLAGIQNGVLAVLKPYFDALGVAIDGVDVDEAAIISGVLAGLAGADGAAETIADAVVAALPADLATDVANQILAKQGQAMVDAAQEDEPAQP